MSSAAVVEKPLCRGRGIGIGWIGKYKPKPCRVTKDEIVNVPQSYTDAERDAVSKKPPLVQQTSVENLSDRIARDILSTQTEGGKKKKVVSTFIDLTGEDDEEEKALDNSGDSSQSWIDSIDSTLGVQDSVTPEEKIIKNEIDDDEKKCNTNLEITTESVMKAYTDECHESPNTSPRQSVNLCTLENDKKINNLDEKGILIGANTKYDLDEKPELCDSITRLNLSSDSNDSITDEINASKNIKSPGHQDIFLMAVHADEFVPSWCVSTGSPEEERNIQNEEAQYIVEDERNTIVTRYIPADERSFIEDEGNNEGKKRTVYPYSGPQPFEGVGEDHIVLHVLDDVILTLMENPGDFDNVIEQLTDHLVNFVTQEDTLKQVVDRIVGKAIEESNFIFMAAKLSQHFDESKALVLENGITFRTVFFKRCHVEFELLMELCKDVESCKENYTRITRTTLLFGELLCTMKLKGKVNPVYRNHIIPPIIDIFLNIGSEETIVILTTLLKLVGPELDIDRPKDVEALFDKVKDFYLDPTKSDLLPKSVKTNLWTVYKLHSRDWDRATSPLDSPSNRDAKFFNKPEQSGGSNQLVRQKSSEKSSKRSSPIDWNEYYDGDDLDLYQNYMERTAQADEECDAFEEFLRMSGQV